MSARKLRSLIQNFLENYDFLQAYALYHQKRLDLLFLMIPISQIRSNVDILRFCNRVMVCRVRFWSSKELHNCITRRSSKVSSLSDSSFPTYNFNLYIYLCGRHILMNFTPRFAGNTFLCFVFFDNDLDLEDYKSNLIPKHIPQKHISRS